MIDISLKKLIEAGAHFGHQTKRWNPKMEEFLYGEKEGVHIFDLIKTKELLEEALDFVKKSVKGKKTILFVGTKKQVKDKIVEVAKVTDSFYVKERWLGGTITNFGQIKKTAQKLTDLKKGFESGEYKDRTKKEKLLLKREIQKLEKFLSGLVGMEETPDVLVIFDIKRELTAVKEAMAKNIPTVAIVDSNCDPTPIDYPIPMNDDASRALEYVLDLFKETILDAKKAKKGSSNKAGSKAEASKSSKSKVKSKADRK
ncbi:30S ribosomal protein S2 [Patescibacteria group bacterium]